MIITNTAEDQGNAARTAWLHFLSALLMLYLLQFIQANSSFYARFKSAFDNWDNFNGNFLGKDCLYFNGSGQVTCDPKVTISVTTSEVNLIIFFLYNWKFRILVAQIWSPTTARQKVTLARSIMAKSSVLKRRKSTTYSTLKFLGPFTPGSISWPVCTNSMVMKYSLPDVKCPSTPTSRKRYFSFATGKVLIGVII